MSITIAAIALTTILSGPVNKDDDIICVGCDKPQPEEPGPEPDDNIRIEVQVDPITGEISIRIIKIINILQSEP